MASAYSISRQPEVWRVLGQERLEQRLVGGKIGGDVGCVERAPVIDVQHCARRIAVGVDVFGVSVRGEVVGARMDEQDRYLCSGNGRFGRSGRGVEVGALPGDPQRARRQQACLLYTSRCV